MMLVEFIFANGEIIPLPPITEEMGECSMTDYSSPERSILMVTPDGRIRCSHEGLSYDQGMLRAVIADPEKLIVEKELKPGESYTRPFTTKMIRGNIRFTYE